ncbi:putative membrane protein [Pseudomonas sp. F-14 TE3623]
MTGFELVSLAVGVAGVLAGLVAVPAFVLMWTQATEDQKERFRRFWAKLGQKAYRVWVYLSCAVLVATGVGKVAQFATNSAPMTRLDVLLLLMNLMSLTVFSVVSLVVIVGFQLTDKKKSAHAASL